MYNILLVEDDKDIQEVNSSMLKRRGGYNVHLAMNLEQARQIVATTPLDIILLDVMLPDGSGLDFLTELRQDKNIPVLILSALGKLEDKLKGFEAGGNGYLPKPYDNMELLYTIESMLKLKEQVPEEITRGSLTLQISSNQALVGGVNIGLTKDTEFSLLNFLVQNENKDLTSEFLYEKVWGKPMAGNNRALVTAVSAVRKKLEGSGFTIANVRNTGYRFEAEI